MSKRTDLTTKEWSGYELLDSGENMKLERFGDVIIARPETQALWSKAHPKLWSDAMATFSWEGKKGAWKTMGNMPKGWSVVWNKMHLNARLTSFKHTGIFPEQAPNWEWLETSVSKIHNPKILNLFGYTGASSIVSALSGGTVTHVDASKQSLTWAHENADLSKIPEGGIRYILDDARSFAKREVRRGSQYDGIILDPPAFGRGAKGEVWHIEKNLPILIEILRDLLSDNPNSFFLINGYAAGYAPKSFLQLIESAFPKIEATYGELSIAESGSDRVIPAGIYVRFARRANTA